MTPRLAEIIAAMLDAKLDAEAGSNRAGRGTIASRPARTHHPEVPRPGRTRPHRREGH